MRYFHARHALIGFLLVAFGTASAFQERERWSAKDSPVINFGHSISRAIWNDPCVIKEGDTYRMWLSGGGIDKVRIYEARSNDGENWDINKRPQLEPGRGWESMAVETPSVVKVGSTYHMYYTGYEKQFSFDIGHATSRDGVNWTKDRNNPVIQRASRPNEWGWITVAEPAITHVNGTFYLYYTMVRCRSGNEGNKGCKGPEPKPIWGIGLATSRDGSSFEPYSGNPVLTQSSNYPPSRGYGGYSTPAVLVKDGTFHLYYDVFQRVGGEDYRQVAIAHATSQDGMRFREVQADVITRDQGSWTAFEVRAPSVIDDDGVLKMWFAGNSGNDPRARGFRLGIGMATLGESTSAGRGSSRGSSRGRGEPREPREFSPPSSPSEGEELTENGGMEEGSRGGHDAGDEVSVWNVPPGFDNAGRRTWSDQDSRNGRYGKRIRTSGNRPFFDYQYLKDSRRVAGSEVVLSAWVRANKSGSEVTPRLVWSGRSEGHVDLLDSPPGDTEWHFYTKTIPVPQGAEKVAVACYVGPKSDGSFDDVSVKLQTASKRRDR
jgi:predicted GH43/DUF377 family glycosyl hydrolase